VILGDELVMLLWLSTGDQLLLYRRDVADTDTASVCAACVRLRATTDSESRHPRSPVQPCIAPSVLSAAAAAASIETDEVCAVHSCAHITLGYTASSEASQAGDDLLRMRRLQRTCRVSPVSVSGGSIRYYGDALCAVQFAQPLHFPALFSPVY